jgi:predicted SprT family Zn-dependent metalloprotease
VALGLIQRLLADPATEPLLAEVRAGGASFREVVFTRNRRVMVSIGDGGKTLRLHERFREAPLEVWRAIGCVLSKKPERTRLAAKEVIVAFLRANPPEAGTPRRRVARTDRSDLARLAAEFDRVNEEFFSGALPRVPLSLSGRMRRRNGHFSTHPLEIVISRRLCRKALAGEAEKTLRHEMIHLWQHVQGHKPGHGRDFRRWAERLGVHPRATRDVTWACDTTQA